MEKQNYFIDDEKLLPLGKKTKKGSYIKIIASYLRTDRKRNTRNCKGTVRVITNSLTCIMPVDLPELETLNSTDKTTLN